MQDGAGGGDAGTFPWVMMPVSRRRGPCGRGGCLGHRSLPASLPSSAWALATSTAAGPCGPERTIHARGRGARVGDPEAQPQAEDSQDQGGRPTASPPLPLPSTFHPPQG